MAYKLPVDGGAWEGNYILKMSSLYSFVSGDNGNHQTDGCVPLHGEKLGMEDRRIANASITASSLSDPDQGAFYAGLNLAAISGVTPGAWILNTDDPNPWLKVSLIAIHFIFCICLLVCVWGYVWVYMCVSVCACVCVSTNW